MPQPALQGVSDLGLLRAIFQTFILICFPTYCFRYFC